MKLKLFSLLIILVSIVSGAGQAKAQLLNQTVNGTYYFPNSSSVFTNQGNKLVNPTASFVFPTGNPNVSVTVGNSIIGASFDNSGSFTTAPFNGFIITDISNDPMITGVSVMSNIAGFGAGNVSFTHNSVSVNLQSLSTTAASTLSVTLQTNASPTPTPEFGSVFSLGGLMAAGGAGLWLQRRRRKSLVIK